MNDLELERIGRQAAAVVRTEATRIADSESALADLLADGPAHLAATPAHEPPSRRPMWIVLATAAAVVAAVASVALVNRGDDAAPAVSTDPTLATLPPVDETVPPPDTTAAPLTVPTPAPDATPPATPPTTETAIPPMTDPAETIEIADAFGEPLERRVLATYTTGDGDGQLGYEQCQECEPLRAWRPVVTADGAVVVADAVNQRWQVFRDGAWTAIPYADGMPIAGAPVVGPDGYIYATRAAGLGQSNPRHVAAFDPMTLDVVAEYAGGLSGYYSVDLVNGQIEVGGRTVVELGSPLGMPTWQIDWETNRVTIAISGIAREFQLPATWHARHDGVAALGDGSVVLQITAVQDDTPNTDSTSQWLVLRLWVDGTYAVGTTATNAFTTNLDVSFSPTGMVQLEGEIVEYAYPEFAGADPLAEWIIPGSITSSLDGVPRLMPAVLPDTASTFTRHDWANDPSPPYGYTQVWVRADAAGTVDGFVEITTRLDPQLLQDSDGDVEVPGWKRAYFTRSAPPFQNLTAHTATRTLSVSTQGLSRDEVAAIAAGLTPDADGAGWTVPPLSADAGWSEIAAGWTGEGATRGAVAWTATDGIAAEWSVARGSPGLSTGARMIDSELSMTEIDGHRALLIDNGFARAVTWSPEPDLVVMVGALASTDELLAIAGSMAEVGQAEWEAIPPYESDGCASLFC